MFKPNIQSRDLGLQVLGYNEEERWVDYEITNETEDSYNTVFRVDGWDFTRYNKNSVVLYNHDDRTPDPDLILGNSEIRTEGKSVVGRVFFEPAELNTLADKVFRKSIRGTLKGASIRANIKDGHWGDKNRGEKPDVLYFTNQELLEFSIVPIPSNPDALRRNLQTLEEIKKDLVCHPERSEGSVETGEGEQRTAQPEENNTLSRFEAQLMINENLK